MKITSGRNFLLAQFPPFAICVALIYIPYFFFRQSDLFMISMKHSALEHALYGLLPIGLILFSAWLFGRGGAQGLDISYTTSRTIWLALWGLLAVSGSVQVIQLLFAASGFLSGGYIAARDSATIQGIGVIIRLDIILLPLLAALSKKKKSVLRAFIAFSILHVARAVLMSERVAIIEILCIAWVLFPLCGVYSISIKKLLIAILASWIMFSLLLQVRLDQQSQMGGKFDASSTSLVDSLFAYYADTTNKYYLIADGNYRYPGIHALSPLLALTDGGSERASQYRILLDRLERSTLFISKGLTNPGGLAQDISDFGWLGYFFVFLKFSLFSFMWRLRFRSPLFIACAPLVLIAVLEYPRFNYFYMPFAAYLFLFALGTGFVLNKVSSAGFKTLTVNNGCLSKLRVT